MLKREAHDVPASNVEDVILIDQLLRKYDLDPVFCPTWLPCSALAEVRFVVAREKQALLRLAGGWLLGLGGLEGPLLVGCAPVSLRLVI
jgi:hypothetical protein